MADKSPNEVDYDPDEEDDDLNGTRENAPSRIDTTDKSPQVAPKPGAYGGTARALNRKKALEASDDGKEPGGTEPKEKLDPGAQSDPMDPAAEVPAWHREILGTPVRGPKKIGRNASRTQPVPMLTSETRVLKAIKQQTQ